MCIGITQEPCEHAGSKSVDPEQSECLQLQCDILKALEQVMPAVIRHRPAERGSTEVIIPNIVICDMLDTI